MAASRSWRFPRMWHFSSVVTLIGFFAASICFVAFPLHSWSTLETTMRTQRRKKAVSFSSSFRPTSNSVITSFASSTSLLASFDPNFARRVAIKVHPSVALVLPVGVRNMTSQGSGFVVDLDTTLGNKDKGNSGSSSGSSSSSSSSSSSIKKKKRLHLLTAAHVAAPGLRLSVSFSGDSQDPENANFPRPATCIGRDVSLDLALIEIEEQDDCHLPNVEPLALSSFQEEQVGTLAFANGYPAGISSRQPAMTMGIVCGMAHASLENTWFAPPQPNENQNNSNTTNPISDPSSITSSDHKHNISFVVTDAAMAGGMSGGPLVNIYGQVLGVNALVRMDMRALGNYAVSASTCQGFLTRLAQQHQKRGKGVAKDQKALSYQVILYNDPMNKRSRVSQVLQEVASLNETDADSVMMSAHTAGRGIVQEFSPDKRTEANVLCEALRKQDVLAEVETVMVSSSS